MSSRIVTSMHTTSRPHATCETDDCDWSRDGFPNARDAAKSHVRETGHQVAVVVTIRDRYQPEVRFRERTLSDDHYRRVADTYLQAQAAGKRAVVGAVAAEFSCGYSTAIKWVREARERGLLPHTPRSGKPVTQ